MMSGFAGIDDDRIDVADIVQADVNPSSAGIGGFVHAVAGSLLAGADVNGTGIRRREGDGADRSDVFGIKDRFPYLRRRRVVFQTPPPGVPM